MVTATLPQKRKLIIKSGETLSYSGDGVPDYVDTNSMSARAVISTPREDREGDIILPAGGRFEDYMLNPAVLWGHGFENICKPIAKCVTPEGQLALEVTDEQIIARSYFDPSDKESSQIFHLIATGIVRATSIQANPVEFETRRASNGMTGRLVKVWDLIEWSWCAIGMNPDAVAKVLAKGLIEGSRIAEPLLKSLTAVAPEKSGFFKGITIPKELTVSEETTTEEVENIEKSDPGEEVVDPETADTEPVDQDLEKMDDTMQEDDPNVPMGAKVLASLHRDLGALKSQLEMAVKAVEQPAVNQAVSDLAELLNAGMEAIEGVHGETYPESEPLARMDSTEAEEMQKAAAKNLGIWLTKGSNKHRLAGIRSRLKEIAENKSLTPAQQRGAIAVVYRSLQTIEKQAKASQPIPYQKEYEDLKKAFDKLEETVNNLLPADK